MLLASTVTAFQCTQFMAPIPVKATSYELAFPPFLDHYQSVAFSNALTARNASAAPPLISGSNNFTGVFNISAEYCTPSNGNSRGIQVLSHGLGFDKSYWNLGGADSQYNYVRVATNAGFSTLSYDRIGNGLSSHPNPYTTQQLQVEIAVLVGLTAGLKAGTLSSSVPKANASVFHVGHSYGSVITHGLATAAPPMSDGIVLTGYSTNLTWEGEFLISTGFHLANENQPSRFGGQSSGYLTWGDELANQYIFFAYPFFDPAVFAYSEAHKFPFSVGELVTGAVPADATAFNKPVLVRRFSMF